MAISDLIPSTHTSFPPFFPRAIFVLISQQEKGCNDICNVLAHTGPERGREEIEIAVDMAKTLKV